MVCTLLRIRHYVSTRYIWLLICIHAGRNIGGGIWPQHSEMRVLSLSSLVTVSSGGDGSSTPLILCWQSLHGAFVIVIITCSSALDITALIAPVNLCGGRLRCYRVSSIKKNIRFHKAWVGFCREGNIFHNFARMLSPSHFSHLFPENVGLLETLPRLGMPSGFCLGGWNSSLVGGSFDPLALFCASHLAAKFVLSICSTCSSPASSSSSSSEVPSWSVASDSQSPRNLNLLQAPAYILQPILHSCWLPQIVGALF